MKKQLLAAVLSAACFLPVWYLPAYAEGEETAQTETAPGDTQETGETTPRVEDLYRYKVTITGEAEIYDFLPSDTYEGELVIPAELDGSPVCYIGNAAFMNAAGVTSITIPASVNDIGSSAFFGCTSLEKFIVQEGNSYLRAGADGVLLADEGKFLVAYPAARPDATYQIPDAIDEIAPGAFGFSQNLKQITVPGHVQYIDAWAFAYSGIEKAAIQGCLYLDEYAFAYCDKLEAVEFSAGTETIYDAAFSGCAALTDVTLPDTLTYVGQCAFCGTAMHSVTIPYSVDTIDYSAFGYDADLKQISDFVVYGYAGTVGESYCTTQDPENDYYNDFTFLEVQETDAGTDGMAEDAGADGMAEATGDTAEAAATGQPEDAATEATEHPVRERLGTEMKDNVFLRILMLTLGAVAVVLAGVLFALAAKKPKPHRRRSDAGNAENPENAGNPENSGNPGNLENSGNPEDFQNSQNFQNSGNPENLENSGNPEDSQNSGNAGNAGDLP